MAWLYLIAAGIMEIGWAVGLRYTEGLTKIGPTLLVWAAMMASFILLEQAIRVIPIGTAYAVWVGIGAVGVAVAGVVLFQEVASAGRLLCIGLILAGVIGLKFLSEAK